MNSSLITLGHSVATSDCLEALLRNIEGLVAIAAHNARQQQNQLNMHKGKKVFDFVELFRLPLLGLLESECQHLKLSIYCLKCDLN